MHSLITHQFLVTALGGFCVILLGIAIFSFLSIPKVIGNDQVKKSFDQLKRQIATCCSITELSILDEQVDDFFNEYLATDEPMVRALYQQLNSALNSKRYSLRKFPPSVKFMVPVIVLLCILSSCTASRPTYGGHCPATKYMSGYK
jgi:hypothetical protein